MVDSAHPSLTPSSSFTCPNPLLKLLETSFEVNKAGLELLVELEREGTTAEELEVELVSLVAVVDTIEVGTIAVGTTTEEIGLDSVEDLPTTSLRFFFCPLILKNMFNN